MWLYSLFRVGAGRKPKDRFCRDVAHMLNQVFSKCSSYCILKKLNSVSNIVNDEIVKYIDVL